VALIDTNRNPFTQSYLEMIRQRYEDGEISRKEFLDYLPAYVNSDMIDERGYLTPANPAPFEIPEPIFSRFDILDL
jgi:hypothetical protein